jgi:hypothetical protein
MTEHKRIGSIESLIVPVYTNASQMLLLLIYKWFYELQRHGEVPRRYATVIDALHSNCCTIGGDIWHTPRSFGDWLYFHLQAIGCHVH